MSADTMVERAAIRAWEDAPSRMTGCFRLWNEVSEKEKDQWRTIARAAIEAIGIERLEAEKTELRAERDALLQKPLDLAKMDSIDDDVADKMLAYYWHGQATEAREEGKRLEAEKRLCVEALSEIEDFTQGYGDIAGIVNRMAAKARNDLEALSAVGEIRPEPAKPADV